MSKRWKRRTASSDEGRESQMVSLAMDLAQRQLEEGTASSQVITHYLKLGTVRERLEEDRLRQEVELLRSKVDQLASAKKVEELYAKALNAMRTYAGQEVDEIEDPDGEDPDLY